jgi:Ca2+-dependent lipid-binding protein
LAAAAAGKSDPFVELFTTKDDMRTTRVINNSLTPEWNEVRSLKRCNSALAQLTLSVDFKCSNTQAVHAWLCVCCIQYAGRRVQMLAHSELLWPGKQQNRLLAQQAAS